MRGRCRWQRGAERVGADAGVAGVDGSEALGGSVVERKRAVSGERGGRGGLSEAAVTVVWAVSLVAGRSVGRW